MSSVDRLPEYRCGCGQLYKYDAEYDSVLVELVSPSGKHPVINEGGCPGYFMGFGPRSIFEPDEAHVPCRECGAELWFVNQPRLFAPAEISA